MPLNFLTAGCGRMLHARARFLAAVLPGAMALRFMLAGLGVTDEARLVAGTAVRPPPGPSWIDCSSSTS